ncbi:glutaredoxin domain-containing protein [Kocuria rosea]|uniref:glutaredoxin domain-containing protein n=1 Tax=Kocuria rosea TaxID=1275 RepID=UPI0011A1F615|nr:glutaredoxin domain-containing protein [Kocuria rosea]
MATVTLYTAPHCTDCTAAAQAMDRKHVPYALISLAAAPTSLDYVKSLGHQRAPVTVVQNDHGTVVDHWSGYRPDKLLHLTRTLNT